MAEALQYNSAFEDAADFMMNLLEFSLRYFTKMRVLNADENHEIKLKIYNLKQFKTCDRKEFNELQQISKYLSSIFDVIISFSGSTTNTFLTEVNSELLKKFENVEQLLNAKERKEIQNFENDRMLDELLAHGDETNTIEDNYDNAFLCNITHHQRFPERFIANTLNSTNVPPIDASSYYSTINNLQNKLKFTSSTYDLNVKSLLNFDNQKLIITHEQVGVNNQTAFNKASGFEKEYEHVVTVGPFKVWKLCENNLLFKCCYEGCNKVWDKLSMLHCHVQEAHLSSICNWSCSLCDDLIDETIYEKIHGVPDMMKALTHLADNHLLKRKRGVDLLNKYHSKLNRFIPVNNIPEKCKTKDKSNCKRLFQCFKESCFFNTDDDIKSLNHYVNEFPSDGKVKCIYCDVLIKNPSSYCTHIITEHGPSIYHCVICSYRSVSKCNVIQHELDKHVQIKPEVVQGNMRSSPPNCEVDITVQSVLCPAGECTFNTNLITKLFEHHTKEHKSEEMACPICFELMSDIEAYLHHIEVHNIYTKHCRFCSLGFSDDLNLRRHLYTIHPTVIPKAIFRSNYDDEKDELGHRFLDIKRFDTRLEPLVVVFLDSEITPVFRSAKITNLDDFEKDKFCDSDDEIEISAPEPVIYKEPLVLTDTDFKNDFYNTIKKPLKEHINEKIKSLMESEPVASVPIVKAVMPAPMKIKKKKVKRKFKKKVKAPDVIAVEPITETIVVEDSEDEYEYTSQLRISSVMTLNGEEASMWADDNNVENSQEEETVISEEPIEVVPETNYLIPLSELYGEAEENQNDTFVKLAPPPPDTELPRRIGVKPISLLLDKPKPVEMPPKTSAWHYFAESLRQKPNPPTLNTIPILKKINSPNTTVKRLVYKKNLIPVPSSAVNFSKPFTTRVQNNKEIPITNNGSSRRNGSVKNVARKSTSNGQF